MSRYSSPIGSERPIPLCAATIAEAEEINEAAPARTFDWKGPARWRRSFLLFDATPRVHLHLVCSICLQSSAN